MKLKQYKTYETFKTIIFKSDTGYQVEFVIWNDGDITLESERISLAEVKECIDIIESGKLEITL